MCIKITTCHEHISFWLLIYEKVYHIYRNARNTVKLNWGWYRKHNISELVSCNLVAFKLYTIQMTLAVLNKPLNVIWVRSFI